MNDIIKPAQNDNTQTPCIILLQPHQSVIITIIDLHAISKSLHRSIGGTCGYEHYKFPCAKKHALMGFNSTDYVSWFKVINV